MYSGSDEIYKYFSGFASKFGLHKYVKTRHEIVAAAWAEDCWNVTVKDLENGTTFSDQCDFLINAVSSSTVSIRNYH